MSAVFLVFGACGMLAILLTAVQRLHNGAPLGEEQEEVQNEKLDTKLDKVIAELEILKQAVGVGLDSSPDQVSDNVLGSLISPGDFNRKSGSDVDIGEDEFVISNPSIDLNSTNSHRL